MAMKYWLNLIGIKKYSSGDPVPLKVHKREKFFSSDFEFFTILYLVKLKY